MKAFLLSVCVVPALYLTAVAGDHAPGEKSDLAAALTSSQWKNAGNSVLTVTGVGPNGQFVGTYVNGETRKFPCARSSDVFQAEGQVHDADPSTGNNITFAVNWTNANTDCDSVTRWTGVLDVANGTMNTNWVLAVDGSTNASVGADVFTRQ